MSIFKLITASIVVLATAVVINTNTAHAASCQAEVITPKDHFFAEGKDFSVQGDRVSVQFKITGDQGCTTPVTLASWKSPNNTDGKPYNQQVLFDHVSTQLGVGTHSLSVNIPDCYWQADLVGIARPTAADGTAGYQPEDKLVQFKFGGDKTCVEKTPVTPTTTVQPATPAVQQTVAQPAQPAVLPQTGPASIASVFAGMSVLTAIGHAIVRKYTN